MEFGNCDMMFFSIYLIEDQNMKSEPENATIRDN